MAVSDAAKGSTGKVRRRKRSGWKEEPIIRTKFSHTDSGSELEPNIGFPGTAGSTTFSMILRDISSRTSSGSKLPARCAILLNRCVCGPAISP
jgi:hypothetical protein